MASIKATTTGNFRFLVDVKRTTAEVLERTVDMLGERATTRARSAAPRGATRELAGSITYRGKPQRLGYEGEIRVGADYAPFVLFGTKSRGLSSPHHPLARDYMGIAANDFFFPHIASARRDLKPEGIKALRRALRR